MKGEPTVLCVSTDTAFATRTSAQLEEVSPTITLRTADSVEAAVDVIDSASLDGVVTDVTTALSNATLFRAVRRHYPDLALVVYVPFATDEGDQVAIADVLEFADVVDDPGGSSPLARWVESRLRDDDSGNGPEGRIAPNTLVEEVKLALVDATSPADIEGAVCEPLTGADRFSFAWVGEYDTGEGRVIPWALAEAGDDRPTSKTFGVQEESAIKRALSSHDPVVVTDIESHGPPVPWRRYALDRDCRSMLLVPLCSHEELVGLLGVYTDERGFSDGELTALRELGTTAGDVLGSMLVRDQIDQQERSLRRYERLVETVGDGMYSLDPSGHFMTVNDALLSMTGYSREGILGEPISLILGREEATDAHWIEDAIERLRADDAEETTTLEVDVQRKDGSTFPGENKIALLPGDSPVRGTVGVLRDVTERKERERELKRQNERVEAFASIVSHDLRNPLGVAQGYVQQGALEGAAADQVADALDRMETIIDDVLALARHGEMVTDAVPVELRRIAVEAWNNVDTKSARLVIDSSEPIVLDRSNVLRLFENCYRNAVEHAGSDVTVTVGMFGAEPPTTAAGFYIADDGSGMNPEVRERMFESSVTTEEDGHGLGLWIVREVADAHDWTIQATESAAGGARFEFANVTISDSTNE
jgi:PAS domain S-box-containing protein